MTFEVVDTLARRTGSTQDRRASLKGLGVAALAAVLAAPLPAAGKKKNKNKKKCNAEKARCQAAVDEFCGDGISCLEDFADCCNTCDAGATAECIFSQFIIF